MISIRNKRGFTTVELLLTIIVGAIFVIGINTIYTAQVSTNRRGRDNLLVSSFAESKVEALRSAGYLSLSNGTTNIDSELPDELIGATGTVVVSSYNTSVKKIDITINYSESGSTKTQSFTTFLGELGVGQQ